VDLATLERLREAANRGGGHAALALSQVIGDRRIDIDVPAVGYDRGAELLRSLGGAASRVAAVHLRLLGSAAGDLFLVLPEQGAQALAEILLRAGSPAPLDPEARSALTETGGLVAAALIGAISRATGLPLLANAPRFVRCSLGDLVGRSNDAGLHLLTRFSDRPCSGRGAEPLRSFFGHFVVLPGEAVLRPTGASTVAYF
jgi:chemotaxis protein CheY-P-specific phosphatase CheC